MNAPMRVRAGVCCFVAAMLAVPVVGQDATFFIEDLDGSTEGVVDATGPNAMALEVFVAADPPITVWGYGLGAACEGSPVSGTGNVFYVAGALAVDTGRPDFLFAECFYNGCLFFPALDTGACPGSPPRYSALTAMSSDAVAVGPDVNLCGCPDGGSCLVYGEGGSCVDDTDCRSALGEEYDGVCYHLEYVGAVAYECEVGSAGAFEIGTGDYTFLQNPDGTNYTYETQPYTLWCGECNADTDCDDGDLCTEGTCDMVWRQCAYTPVDCTDGNECTDDFCDPESGCTSTPNTYPCDDQNMCTEADVCSGGICSGLPVDCGQCTPDACDPEEGCLIVIDPCDDGNVCTNEYCDMTFGCIYTYNTYSCDDGDTCTENDTCDEGVCRPGPPPHCDDGDPCTGPDVCLDGVCAGPPGYTWPFGDVTATGAACPPMPPDRERSGCGVLIGLPDLAYVLSAFAEGADWAYCYPNADLMSSDPEDPCGPDGAIALPDVVGILQAFAQEAECESPCACP